MPFYTGLRNVESIIHSYVTNMWFFGLTMYNRSRTLEYYQICIYPEEINK